jgi:hypothetical protein
MPQCQFLFLAIFVFQKCYTGNILRIGQNESQSSYLPDTKTESKGETEEDQEVPAPRPTSWPRRPVVWAPRPPSDIALLPINSLRPENPKGQNIFPWNILQATAIVDPRLGGSRSSSWHPAGEGNYHLRPSSSPCQPPEWCASSQPLDHVSIAVARWLSSPPCASCLDLVSCLSLRCKRMDRGPQFTRGVSS